MFLIVARLSLAWLASVITNCRCFCSSSPLVLSAVSWPGPSLDGSAVAAPGGAWLVGCEAAPPWPGNAAPGGCPTGDPVASSGGVNVGYWLPCASVIVVIFGAWP